MPEHAKSHRWPITLEIGGQTNNEFVAVGQMARALRRTVWTVSYWERIKLLPEAPVIWFQGNPFTRRRLYPTDYVDALDDIAGQGYLGTRLERDDWEKFQIDIWAAYNRFVVPITGGVVFDATDQMPMDRSGQGSRRHDLSAH